MKEDNRGDQVVGSDMISFDKHKGSDMKDQGRRRKVIYEGEGAGVAEEWEEEKGGHQVEQWERRR